MTLTVYAFDHLVLNVSDVEASAAWYQAALGMTRDDFGSGDGQRKRTALKFGNQKINLRPVTTDQATWFTAEHRTAGSDDLCFLTSAEPNGVVEHLRACGIAIEAGPTVKQGARGSLRSVYCRDPDGNLIEIASYAG